jgi:hypothetical protein
MYSVCVWQCSIVLFPTETIPLRIKDSNFASYLRSLLHSSTSTHAHARVSASASASVSVSSSAPILIGIVGKYRESGRVGSRWCTPE